MTSVQLTPALCAKLTPEVLERWAFHPEGLDRDKSVLKFDVKDPVAVELLGNMLAVECRAEMAEEGIPAKDTGLRPAGGDGPPHLRQLLSL